MYCTTIAKIDFNGVWAGFNMMSQLLLQGDIERECESYATQFKPCKKGELVCINTKWHNYAIMIQYRRIS